MRVVTKCAEILLQNAHCHKMRRNFFKKCVGRYIMRTCYKTCLNSLKYGVISIHDALNCLSWIIAQGQKPYQYMYLLPKVECNCMCSYLVHHYSFLHSHMVRTDSHLYLLHHRNFHSILHHTYTRIHLLPLLYIVHYCYSLRECNPLHLCKSFIH